MSELLKIKVSEIRENPVALRAVDHDSEDYVGMRDSIAEKGIITPISVRQRHDPVTGDTFYEIIDGLHRYTCAVESGLETIPAQILDLSDTETLEAQVLANVHKIETRPVEYTIQLKRIFAANPTMTVADMAAKLSKSPSWISQRLGLLKLETSVQKLVDDGKIKLANAYAMARLPKEEQLNFIDQAMTTEPNEFASTINSRAKELRDAARQGRAPVEISEYVPVPRFRKVGELKAELENPTLAGGICSLNGANTAVEGFNLAIKWLFQLDKEAIEIAREKKQAQLAELEEAKKRRAAERAAKRAAEATEAAAKAQEAVAAAG